MIVNKLYILMISVLLSGCGLSGLVRFESSDFGMNYALISNTHQHTKAYYYELAKEKFSKLGYQFTQNDVLTILTTNEKVLGKHRWKRNNNKWDITYLVRFQLVEPEEGNIFWKLDTFVHGKRSGREPRSFSPFDFDETSRIHEHLMNEFSALFVSQA